MNIYKGHYQLFFVFLLLFGCSQLQQLEETDLDEFDDIPPPSTEGQIKYNGYFYVAVENNDLELINHHIKIGTEPNIGIFGAVRNKNIQVVKLLLEHGASANANVKYSFRTSSPTLLMLASGFTQTKNNFHNPHSVEIVNLLLKHGANVNTQSKYGNIISYLVCDTRGKMSDDEQYNLIRLFIENNADVNVPCENSATPLANLFKFKYPSRSDKYYPSQRKYKENKEKMKSTENYLRKHNKVVALIEKSGGIEEGNPYGSWMQQNIIAPVVEPFLKMH